MAFQFQGFKATKPVISLIDADKMQYEVIFFVYDPDGIKHPKRFKKGINCLKQSERKAQAESTADVLWEALNYHNWNPLHQKYPSFKKEEEDLVQHDFNSALDHALKVKKKELSPFSYYDYVGCARFMKAAAKECGLLHSLLKDIKRKHIRMIVATAKEQRNWSNKARNKYLSLLRSLLTIFVDEDRLEYNPAYRIKDEKTEETEGFKRLTDEEKEKIAAHLYDSSIDYFEYLMFIYQDGIRRKELLLIQIKDINLERREITIRPEVAKTNNTRKVPITDDLMEILLRREVWNHPKEWYLFSSDKFRPGEDHYHPNTPTGWWCRLVQEDLGIDCKMYSLKHKGADDKIEAGIDLDILRTLYGHRSKQMTEIYARAVKEKYKQQLINKSPVFAKVIPLRKKAN